MTWDVFCGEKTLQQNYCASDEGSAVICNGLLQGILSSSCSDDRMIITDVSQFYYWILINQLGEIPNKLIDIESEFLRKILGSALKYIAWVSDDPSLADKIDVLKMFY